MSILIAVATLAVGLAAASNEAKWQAAAGIDTASYVMRERQEQVLMYRQGEMAGALIGTFPDNTQTVADTLAVHFVKTVGKVEITKRASSSLTDIVDSMLPEARSEYVRRLDLDGQRPALKALAQEGLRVSSFEEIRLVSKEFNQLEKREAGSVYVAHVLDASVLLGRRGTVIVLYRIDRETRWGWSNVHDLFSFGRHTMQTRLIDAALFGAIGDLRATGLRSAYAGSLGQKQLIEYVDEWRRARDSLLVRP